jgi:hypothetical protein
VSIPAPITPTTNPQWLRLVSDALVANGIGNPVEVYSALQKVLNGLPISTKEKSIWDTAVRLFKQPPESYPPVEVIPDTPPPSQPPPGQPGAWSPPGPYYVLPSDMTVKEAAAKIYKQGVVWNQNTKNLYYKNEGIIANLGRQKGWSMNNLANLKLPRGFWLYLP